MAPGGIDSDGMELSFGRMAKGYLPYEVDQQLLLPPDMRSWLPEGHLAYFVLEVVAEFDLSEFYAVHEAKDVRGRAGNHPAMAVALLINGYCTASGPRGASSGPPTTTWRSG